MHATLSCSLALSILVQSALAMEAPPPAEPSPEVIEITGKQTIFALERQLLVAQDVMFGLFNELNDDDRYDIHCLMERRTGTNISERVCKPRFLRTASAGSARETIADIQGMTAVRVAPVQAVLDLHYPQLEAKMLTLTRENPELFNAVTHHQEILEELKQLKSSGVSTAASTVVSTPE